MKSSTLYLLTADVILLLHILFVAFVVIGLVFILVGKVLRWSWVRNPWFRVMHLIAIGIVVIQTWFSFICPLTTLEMGLRSRAGDVIYEGSFISHWLGTLLYYQLPPWVFIVCYTVFGILVVGSWFWVRPFPFVISERDEG